MYYVITKDDILQAITLVNPYEVFKTSEGYSISTFTGAFPDLNTHKWDGDETKFVRKSSIMSKLSFLNRFTLEERVAARASSDPKMSDFLQMLEMAEVVDLQYPYTIESVNYMVQLGVISSVRAQEVLSYGNT